MWRVYRRSAKTRSLEMRVASFCLALVGVAASGQKAAAGSEDPGVWEPYKQAWDATKEQIDLAEMESWLSHLESEDQDVRTRAVECFREETALEYVTRPPREGSEHQKQLKLWQQYVWYVRAVVETSIPGLLRGPAHDPVVDNRRRAAVMYIGKEAPHPAFVPLLREIALNAEENESVRHSAITALSRIPHEGMVEFLIECLELEPEILRYRALEQLEKLTTPMGVPAELLAPDLKELKRLWQEWWAANKDQFKYKRISVLIER